MVQKPEFPQVYEKALKGFINLTSLAEEVPLANLIYWKRFWILNCWTHLLLFQTSSYIVVHILYQWSLLFYKIFSCPKATFGSRKRGQSRVVNHYGLSNLTWGSRETSEGDSILKPSRVPSAAFELGTLQCQEWCYIRQFWSPYYAACQLFEDFRYIYIEISVNLYPIWNKNDGRVNG